MTIDQERLAFVRFVTAQLVGPAGDDDEHIDDLPQDRYVAGILYPRQVVAGEESDEEEAGAAAEEDSVSTASQWEPSSLGVTLLLTGGGLVCRVQAARYEKQSGSWRRVPLAPEEHAFMAPKDADARIEHQRVAAFDGLAELRTAWRRRHDRWLVTVWLVNTQVADDTGSDKAKKLLCQVNLVLEPRDGHLDEYHPPRDVALSEEELRLEILYRRVRQYAIGHGCAVHWEGNPPSRIETEAMPVARVITLLPREADVDDRFAAPAVLADPGLPVKELVAGLEALVARYERWADGLDNGHEDIPEAWLGVAEDMKLDVRKVAARMRSGIALLERDKTVLRAFRLANLAMVMQMHRTAMKAGQRRRRGDGPMEEPGLADYLSFKEHRWRPFQLAFALMLMPSLADQEHPERDLVDLLWFPTGGGKTEAYLLLAAFAVALRRVRDPVSGGGTAVISRYTLRLLTAQQFERAATLISALDVLRQACARGECEGLEALLDCDLGDEVSLGLWVGKGYVANDYHKAFEDWEQARSAERPRNPFLLEQCPWCGTEVFPEVRSADDADYGIECTDVSFRFFCAQEGCRLHDGIPVRVVDTAVYEDPLPAMVIGTVDKFARLSWVERAGRLLGTGQNEPPTLVIQDELHLASGPLGTLVGAYETAIDGVIELHGGRAKVIASTATIRNSSDQLRQLFGRESALFPPSGLLADDSYFAAASPDGPARVYVGLMAPAKTHQTSLVHLATALLAAPAKVTLSEAAGDAWWTLVTYHDTKETHGRMRKMIVDDVNKRLDFLHPGLRSIADDRVESLTGTTPGKELPAILARLHRRRDEEEAVDSVLATNMLSVGVDIPRLGLMLLDRQPKSTSEYIQATGRVGRSQESPGLVFVYFSTTRPRDRSHYESFGAYHAALHRYVEPTSVTPFSAPARDRALPSILVTLVRQGLGLAGQGDAGRITEVTDRLDQVREIVRRRVERVDEGEVEATMEQLERLLADWEARAEGAIAPKLHYQPKSSQVPGLIKPFERRGDAWPVLNNLRNVDAQVEVRLL